MDPSFWHERWATGQTGWHLDTVNPHLEAHWPRLNLSSRVRVFVPLCGSSRDMLWLAGEGHRVVGVELSTVAAERFFADAGLEPSVREEGPFTRYSVDEIEILCGDFFDLDRERLGAVEAVYDRASLIALPPSMRERYAGQMKALLDDETPVLLITLDYDQEQMAGPPFAVRESEVRALYEPVFDVQVLAAPDVLDESPRFRERGLTALHEPVYILRRWAG